ncbi:protein-glutamine gamma-glutamyltransferase E-like [Hyperolius riggenbachi]|uniref:protein-glutamine gamma-glutamyltransferase E-like n=1 Tax=Hyperolius riggenbachi TaxID=752182 RepID=UPI0035A2E083
MPAESFSCSTSLHVMSSDLLQSANHAAHRTNDYMTNSLVVRRGDLFSIHLVFNKPVRTEDHLSWWAETGSHHTNSKIIVPITSSDGGKPWHVTSVADSETSMTLTIKSPADAAIGLYHMGVKFTSRENHTYKNLGEFILLFNPWCTGKGVIRYDATYMKDSDGRMEYVLNETGIIFYGKPSSHPLHRAWDFGQFEEGILNICLKLLNKGIKCSKSTTKDVPHMGDPTYVARTLTAMISSFDDHGVVGDWSGRYTREATPVRWNGSVEILHNWEKGRPVSCGQCWVYGGVLCTVLRCLGIPARVVTNFSSAHNAILTINRYFDEDGNEKYSPNSVWNFHVWNEAWFARKDLSSPTYDGWQVLDATPQEKGQYPLGPCSVNSIKEGDVDQPYEAPFVFCEMNGDQVLWVTSGHERRKVQVKTHSIGKFTSTKAICSNTRVDTTGNYKYPEGTAKEKEVAIKAKSKLSTLLPDVHILPATDVELPQMHLEGTVAQSCDQYVGMDLIFNLTLKSASTEKLCLQVKMTATAIVHTNALVKRILQNAQSVVLGPKEERLIPFSITYNQYVKAITTDNMIKVVALCEDGKGGKLLVEEVMMLMAPPIEITAEPKGWINEILSIGLSFINPLPKALENIDVTVEGSGLTRHPISIHIPYLQSKQKWTIELHLCPYRAGRRAVYVDLFPNKLFNVKGMLPVEIFPETLCHSIKSIPEVSPSKILL